MTVEAILFALFFCFIPACFFLYNLVAAIYYNVKRAVAIVSTDPSKADEKDGLLLGNIIWASLSLSVIIGIVVLLCHS